MELEFHIDEIFLIFFLHPNRIVSRSHLATNPNIEGETTASYIARFIRTVGDVRVTRIAHGVPVGGDLEYADEVTLIKAIEGRREI